MSWVPGYWSTNAYFVEHWLKPPPTGWNCHHQSLKQNIHCSECSVVLCMTQRSLCQAMLEVCQSSFIVQQYDTLPYLLSSNCVTWCGSRLLVGQIKVCLFDISGVSYSNFRLFNFQLRYFIIHLLLVGTMGILLFHFYSGIVDISLVLALVVFKDQNINVRNVSFFM